MASDCSCGQPAPGAEAPVATWGPQPFHTHAVGTATAVGTEQPMGSSAVLLLLLWCSPKAELEKRTRGLGTGQTGTGLLAGAWHASRVQQDLALLGELRPTQQSRLLCHRCRQWHGAGSRLARAGRTAGPSGVSSSGGVPTLCGGAVHGLQHHWEPLKLSM